MRGRGRELSGSRPRPRPPSVRAECNLYPRRSSITSTSITSRATSSPSRPPPPSRLASSDAPRKKPLPHPTLDTHPPARDERTNERINPSDRRRPDRTDDADRAATRSPRRRLVHPSLERPRDAFVLGDDVHDAAPPRETIASAPRQQTLRDHLEQLLRFQVGLRVVPYERTSRWS